MSTVVRPQGRLPARVYWTRRALVLVTALLLVVGFARLFSSGSDGDGPKATAEIVAGQASQDASAAPSNDPSASAGDPSPKAKQSSAAPSASPTEKPLAQPSGPCRPADITVKPTVKRQYADGKIEIPFEITGKAAACTWQVSNKSMVIRITSGKDSIWSSQECAKIASQDVVVRSEAPVEIVFVWNGRRSDDNCSRTAKWALPGYYHVTAAALGGEPSDRQFELLAPKPKKVYETETPKPDEKASGQAG
ncbi:hypothetical protein [Nocardioides sp. AE5]|uniref:hypothetical protein n=1 Tax=Nocardioides sp. AE5 TaxID=2962573 RepID=UPI002882A53B|nr:hypothetical protein [Nocardioides sp. AE5]MDT0200613.1 hypothetical protein [Nocardioides sp. AE5]